MKRSFLLTLLALPLWVSGPALAQPATGGSLPHVLEVTVHKTTVLLFPNNIRKVDIGSEDITAGTVKIGDNERILRVKANRDTSFVSNLHVFCDDGRIFTFEVRYVQDPFILTHDLRKDAAAFRLPPAAAPAHMLPAQVRQYAAAIAALSPVSSRPRVHNNGMRLQMTGVYVYNGVLFFQFRIRNSSGIPYDVDFSRFYIRDQKTTRRSTAMEKEVVPLFVYQPIGDPVDKNETQTLVAAFDKFTISEQKLFMAEVFEHNGDRHLRAGLKGKHLLRARPLPPLAPHADPPIVAPGPASP